MRKSFLTLIALCFCTALFAAVYLTRAGCNLVDGKWGQAEGLCTTRLCYYLGDCGHWAQPQLRCPELAIGDSRAEVIFQLGEPDTKQGDRLSWYVAKADPQMFSAHFDGNRLTAIECGGSR